MSEVKKEKINVLSLFDGISCGQIALNKIGIKYDNYFASEIDKHAIKVTQHNYPNTIQLGSVTEIKGTDLPQIDLLIGGSPCQGFSFVGKGLNFKDPRSKLFFEFARLKNETQPKYWMMENVKMKKEYEDVITEILNVIPIELNSRNVSAQNRKRLYWTNIPNILELEDKNINLEDILISDIQDKFYIKNRNKSISYTLKKYDEFKNKYGYHPKMFNPYNCKEITKKSPTLTSVGCRVGNSSTVLIGEDMESARQLTPLEWEKLQNVPDNYTDCISDTHRFNTLGNGWTVDVIAHILSFIT
jgi:DNA-cytosine methyltransferase